MITATVLLKCLVSDDSKVKTVNFKLGITQEAFHNYILDYAEAGLFQIIDMVNYEEYHIVVNKVYTPFKGSKIFQIDSELCCYGGTGRDIRISINE